MNAIDFFDSDIMELPKERNTDDFQAYMDQLFKHYLIEVQSLDASDQLANLILKQKKKINDLCDGIKSTVGYYFGGSPYDAYKQLYESLQSIKSHINNLLVNKDISGVIGNLFRIRLGTNRLFSKEEMFHIPFEKRHIVKTQRYSIPGFPCLYLSSSVYVAWEEMLKPDYGQIQISRLEPVHESNINVLDFGWRPAQLAALIKSKPGKNEQFIISQAVCWPLLAACSIKCKFPDDTFKAEYIIPQLLLQWIRNTQKYDGIRYFSMHVKNYYGEPSFYQNFAFPVQTLNANGLCKTLASKFRITDPVAWQVATAINKAPNHSKIPQTQIEIIQGLPVGYHITDFGYIQALLSQLSAHSL